MQASERIRGDLVKSLLLVLAAAVVSYFVLVDLAHYVALVFSSVLAAVALTALARRVNGGGRLPHALSVLVVLVVLLLALGAFSWWLGPRLVTQFEELARQIPRALKQAQRWLESTAAGEELSGQLADWSSAVPSASSMLRSTSRFLSAGASAVADVLILTIVALFFATSPERYSRGAVRLLPQRHRSRGATVLTAMASALRHWLLARATLMLLVAILFGVGLLVIGVPLALPLALIAGAFSFVPYIGPTLALVPALAMGLLQSPAHALYVLIIYGVIQLVESYLVEPLVEARAVSLPPALIILAQVVTAVWLGPLGVVIATPLLVVLVVAIQYLYIRGVLGDEVEIIGQ